jgi:hypothetical protein
MYMDVLATSKESALTSARNMLNNEMVSSFLKKRKYSRQSDSSPLSSGYRYLLREELMLSLETQRMSMSFQLRIYSRYNQIF